MNILVIDEQFPYPLTNGKSIRTFNLLRFLAGKHSISYLAYGTSDSEAVRKIEQLGIKCFPVGPADLPKNGLRFYFRLFRNLFSLLPYVVTSHYTSRFQNRLDQLTSSMHFDLIICEWTPYAIYLKRLNHSKSIIVAHNIETDIWQRYEENETNFLKRAYISVQKFKMNRYEQKCFQWANGATAVTNNDARQILTCHVDYPVQVVSNGVDLDYFHPNSEKVTQSQLVFTGSMDWRPNQDAVQYFIKNIFPRAREKCPDLKFTVVGRDPPKEIWNLDKITGVTIAGTVDDIRPYIAQAALYIVPLRIGGGSRLKILEAMAMEKPVLSTSIGAEGLDVRSGKDIFIADSPQIFAEKIITCLANKELLARVARQGRKLVMKKYGWEACGKDLNRYISRIIEGGTRLVLLITFLANFCLDSSCFPII